MRTKPEPFQPRVFLDSSGLISAVISIKECPPIYRLVMLGEQVVIDLRVSREVISDVERFVRSYNPALLTKLAAIIDKGRMESRLSRIKIRLYCAKP